MTHTEHRVDPARNSRARSSLESQGDRDRTLEAMHALERAVGIGSRSDGWKVAVDAALAQLEVAFAEQQASYHDPTSLMAQIAQDDPRVRTFVRQLHHRWDELAATARTLRERVARDEPFDAWAIADVREHIRWLMTALHHHRAREADLAYDALEIDLTGPHPS